MSVGRGVGVKSVRVMGRKKQGRPPCPPPPLPTGILCSPQFHSHEETIVIYDHGKIGDCGQSSIMFNFTPLRSAPCLKKPEMENLDHASRSQNRTILRCNKHADQQVDPVAVYCLQTNGKPRNKMRIHLGCSMTHGRAKHFPH